MRDSGTVGYVFSAQPEKAGNKVTFQILLRTNNLFCACDMGNWNTLEYSETCL